MFSVIYSVLSVSCSMCFDLYAPYEYCLVSIIYLSTVIAVNALGLCTLYSNSTNEVFSLFCFHAIRVTVVLCPVVFNQVTWVVNKGSHCNLEIIHIYFHLMSHYYSHAINKLLPVHGLGLQGSTEHLLFPSLHSSGKVLTDIATGFFLLLKDQEFNIRLLPNSKFSY